MSFPTMLRTFFERAQELTPVGVVELALQGRGTGGTLVSVTGVNTLAFAGIPTYDIKGPPSISPLQLGFERGDLVRLIGQGGGEDNDGALVSLDDPAIGAIYDTLIVDGQNYFFDLIKRRTFVLTNRGREWLACLMPWKTLEDPPATDIPFYEGRLRFVGVGKGSQAEVRDVLALKDPLLITSPSAYLEELDASRNQFRNVTYDRVGAPLIKTQVSFGGQDPTLISEAALYEGESPLPSGSGADAFHATGAPTTKVEGLTNILPLHVGLSLIISNGGGPGTYRITRYLSETAVEIDRVSPTGSDPGLAWEIGLLDTDNNAPCVTYMTFEGLVKSSSFGMAIDWEFRI